MANKFEAIEQKNGTVYVYENSMHIGTINLRDFTLASFARVMRAANGAHLTHLTQRELVNTCPECFFVLGEHHPKCSRYIVPRC